MKKKVGKVRVMPSRGGDSLPPHPPRTASSKQVVTLQPKKVGRVKASALEPGRSVYHKQPCCEGSFVPDTGMWVHSLRCPHTVVLWKAHGHTQADWYCEEGCPGQDLGESITHVWNCAWWDKHSPAVPFGHRKPKIEKGRKDQTVLFAQPPAASISEDDDGDEDDDLPF